MATLTYKYKLKQKASSVRNLRQMAFVVNQVWNYCVATQKKVQQNRKDGLKGSWPSNYDLHKLTAGTSKDLRFSAKSIYGVCDQFVKSRDQHRKCPRFRHSGGSKRSLGWIPFEKQARQLGSNYVTYMKHNYRFFGAKRRPLPDQVKGGCFVEDARGNWWVCLHVIVEDDKRCGSGPVGIDLGLSTLATLSTGEKIEPIQPFKKYAEKLAVAQRSGNKKRTRSLHAKIANVRRDFLHKESTRLIRSFGSIYVGNVARSKSVRNKFAKSAYDAGLATFCNMLRHKAGRHGATYAEVDERFTTQTCSTCGSLPPSSPKGIAGLGIREWKCSACGEIHDRDVNAARNILILGLSTQPPVEGSRGSSE